MRSIGRRRWVARALTALATLSGCTGAEATIAGEIRDDAVVLVQDSGPQSVWLELSNVGAAPCDLVVIRTELDPDALPLDGDRVTLSISGSPQGEAYPMDAYVEIDGQPAGVEDPVRAGRQAVVGPGKTARVQLALTGMPEHEERVIVCNGPGEYEAGRYAVLRFDR
jgi:hypothetical protein